MRVLSIVKEMLRNIIGGILILAIPVIVAYVVSVPICLIYGYWYADVAGIVFLVEYAGIVVYFIKNPVFK